MRVLVTGHRGYIGSVLVSVLRHQRFEVSGLDSDLYQGCDFGRTKDSVPGFETDLRDVEFTDLLSFDAVVHLAGLPEGLPEEFDRGLVEQVNLEATMHLAECCRKAQVSRFVFASTCAVYGRGGGDLLTEQSMPMPTSAYAESKLRCERELARLAGADFTPVLLRFGTAYGVSPRMRLDICVNDFTAAAVTTGRVSPKTSGRAWRPLVHVEDIARAIGTVLPAPDERVRGEVFNVVDTQENHRVLEVADMVAEEVPSCVRGPATTTPDERSYRVSGSKFTERFSDFQFRWTLPLGIRQLRHAIMSGGLTPADCRGDRFRRVPRLQSLSANRHLDLRLRKVTTADSQSLGV